MATMVTDRNPCPVCGGVAGCALVEGRTLGGVAVKSMVACRRPPVTGRGRVVRGMVATADAAGKSGLLVYVDLGSWEAAGFLVVEEERAEPVRVGGVSRLGGAAGRGVLLICSTEDVGRALLEVPEVARDCAVWAAGSAAAVAAVNLPFEVVGREAGQFSRVLVLADLTPWDPDEDGRVGHLAAWKLVARLRERYGDELEVEAAAPGAVGWPAGGGGGGADARVLVSPRGQPVPELVEAGRGVTWQDARVLVPGVLLTVWTMGGRIEDMPGPAEWEAGYGEEERTRVSEDGAPFQPNGGGEEEPAPQALPAARGGRTRASGEGEDGDGGGKNVWDPVGFFATPDGDRIAPKGALARARVALQLMFAPDEPERASSRWTVAYWGATQQWLKWNGRKYEAVRDEVLRGLVLDFFESWRVQNAEGKLSRLGLSTHQAADIVEAMKTDASIVAEGLPAWAPPAFDKSGAPRWGGIAPPPPPGVWGKNVIVFENGLLDVDRFKADASLVLAPHTPLYITTNAMAFELPVVEIREELKEDPAGEARGGVLCQRLCPLWVETVARQSRDSDDYCRCIQQILGYFLDPTIDLEQFAYIIGPAGGGKGTLIEVVMALVGRDAVASSGLKDVGDKFALGSWVGKKVVLFDEVMAGSSTDLPEATRRVLSIVGNAPQEIELKHRDRLPAVKLGVKLLFTGNRVQSFADPANAFARRIVMVHMPRGYEGTPDPSFKARIVKEAPGIMVWALFGLLDLARSVPRRIVQPASGLEQLKLFLRLSSRVRAFMTDCTSVRPGYRCTAELLYRMFGAWCESQGMKTLQQEQFGADLAAAVDEFSSETVLVDGKMTRVWSGIRPKLEIDLVDRSTWGENERRLDSMVITKPGHYLSEGSGVSLESMYADFAAMEFDLEGEHDDGQQRRF